MVGLSLRAAVGVAFLALTLSLQAKVKQCIKEYIPKINGFDLEKQYIDGLLELTDSPERHIKTPNVKVVLDVGLGSMWFSDVFRHMVQLNISGNDQFLRTSFNCEFESIPRENARASRERMISNPDGSLLYSLGHMPFLHLGETWYRLLSNYPNTYVLMNDVTDGEYFENQYSASCRLEWQRSLQYHCFVPLLHLPHRINVNITSHRHMLDKFTYPQVKAMLAAYRSLITCMVPAERLFQFNLHQMPAVEYWSKLTSFLNISLPGTASSSVKYLSEGGTVCDSVSQHTDARHLKRVQCADEYGSRIASIFGERYRRFVRDSLLKNVSAPRRAPEDSDRIVLGIGPGTSGTRSIHFAASQLQVTSLHFVYLNRHPSATMNLVNRTDFEYDMRVLQKDTSGRRIFWSDTPVPNRWWYVYKMYPNTSFMITDLGNDTLWHEKRFTDHCNFRMIINDPSCIAPLPIRHDNSILAMEFFRKAQIKEMTHETNHQLYDAYRALAKCVIPPDRLWWVYMNELKDSKVFWTKLVELLKPFDSNSGRVQAFVDKGIPRCGSKGCFWNGAKYNVTYR